MILYKIIRKIKYFYDQIVNLYILRINRVDNEGGLTINGRILIQNQGSIKIKNNVKINSNYAANPIGGQGLTSFMVKKDAELVIESNSGISNTAICAFKSIYIGPNVLIGGDCKIYDTDFHSIRYDNRIIENDSNIKVAPVSIEEGSFIGGGSIILKGVRIGKFSVVGAGSVVTRDVPDNEIWAGNPARFIKKIV